MAVFTRISNVEAITFAELVQYGRDNGANIVNGMPWSFHYKGQPVSHENDSCYLVGTIPLYFTPEDFLVTAENGGMSVRKSDEFLRRYTRLPEILWDKMTGG